MTTTSRRSRVLPPPVFFGGRDWSTAELAAMAASWWRWLTAEAGGAPGPLALPMAGHPETVALFFALSCFPVPVVLLPADPRGWQTWPPLPRGTRVVVSPASRPLAGAGTAIGLEEIVLPDPGPAPVERDMPFMSAPGFVFFTSGSTGLPRPVYRTADQVLDAGRAPVSTVAFPPGGGVIGSLPLDRTFGMHHTLMAATVLRRPLALLPRFQHRAVLDLFASGRYHYWAGTPVMADVLSRCALAEPLRTPHPAPSFCVISGRLSPSVCRRFEARFGVRLRQVYGTTETGAVTMETAAAADVRSETAGRVLPEVRVRIGDDPRAPLPPGQPGRVWVSSPGCAKGYGFPPNLERLPGVDGWWQSPDLGQLGEDGYLTVLGRLDDCIRTRAGHVLNPTVVAEALEASPGISEAVVVPIGSPADPVLAALVESLGLLDMDEVQDQLRMLPARWRPHVVEQTRALPRLPSGKPDRLACIAILERSLTGRR
jgi:long-chain acyl-CoA synthetase